MRDIEREGRKKEKEWCVRGEGGYVGFKKKLCETKL